MATILYHYKNLFKNFTLSLLFSLIGWLSNTTLIDVAMDTAELVNDRRGLKIQFILGGISHSVVLPYNPYKMNHDTVSILDKETGELLHKEVSSLPGLDDVLYTAPFQGRIYRRNVDVIFDKNDYDD